MFLQLLSERKEIRESEVVVVVTVSVVEVDTVRLSIPQVSNGFPL